MLNFFKNIDSRLRIDKSRTVHDVQELDDCVFLFQLVEPDNCLFPGLVMLFELLLVSPNNALIELVALLVLQLVLLLVVFLELNHHFVHCWLQEESNKHEVVPQLCKEPSAALLLKCLQLV